MRFNVNSSFNQLKSYCEKEEFKGWDPYDGLNSKVFQATPLRKWDLARLAWIQGFKRSPINFRPLLKVPKQYNAKGIGLFLNGYCNLYKLSLNGELSFGTAQDIKRKVVELADLLIEMQNKDYSGACWGYNFDWQARRLFLFPSETPTVVATSFCATALFEAYEITNDERYLSVALSSARFVLKDLSRTKTKHGIILSYSPLDGNNTVYNASLLGAKLLSQCYFYTQKDEYREVARQIVNAACADQATDGSWVYGLLPVQSWIDSFHTGYNLDAIKTYTILCDDSSYKNNIDIGVRYYLNNFFMLDGTPKYYNDKTYPIDIHCPGQLWVTMSRLKLWESNRDLSEKVCIWTVNNMQAFEGYFFYQLKMGISSRISYMRWSNAFMFNALSHYLIEENELQNSK